MTARIDEQKVRRLLLAFIKKEKARAEPSWVVADMIEAAEKTVRLIEEVYGY